MVVDVYCLNVERSEEYTKIPYPFFGILHYWKLMFVDYGCKFLSKYLIDKREITLLSSSFSYFIKHILY